jgi:hypothetical protein
MFFLYIENIGVLDGELELIGKFDEINKVYEKIK